jgi:hypothetical protein
MRFERCVFAQPKACAPLAASRQVYARPNANELFGNPPGETAINFRSDGHLLFFSAAPFLQARNYCSDHGQSLVGERTVASRAELESHSGLLCGAAEVLPQRNLRLGSNSPRRERPSALWSGSCCLQSSSRGLPNCCAENRCWISDRNLVGEDHCFHC